jgi:hypothetical protein
MINFFNIVPRLNIPINTWDEFVDSSDDAWLWHRYIFQDSACTWKGRIDLSFAVCDANKEILALVPLQKISRHGVNFLDVVGGIAIKNGMGHKRKTKLRDFIIQSLHDFCNKRTLEIRFSLSPLTPGILGKNTPYVSPILFHNMKNKLGQTYILDLSVAVDELWKGYNKTTRRDIRKIYSGDYSIKVATYEDLEQYYELHKETYLRSGLEPHPKSYFKYIFGYFLQHKLCRVIFLEKNGKILTAQNTVIYKEAAYYWTGASCSIKNVAGAHKVLMHEQIIWSKQNGCLYYEIGEAFPSEVTGKKKGLNDFKKGFGGNMRPYFKGTILPNNILAKVFDCYQSLI